MAKRFDPYLDVLIVEVRYFHGLTYLDRCGQTLLDIERHLPDWLAGEANPQSGSMENVGLDCSLVFGPSSCAITARRPKDIDKVLRQASEIWSIVQANLGLSEFIRLGARFQYLLPTLGTEESEKRIATAGLGLQLPNEWESAGYTPTVRQMIVVLEREGCEYRVALQGITRTESISPSPLLTAKPQLLWV